MAVLEFNFENGPAIQRPVERYRAKKDQIDRCGIAFRNPNNCFVGAKVHFKDKFFICKQGACCDALGEPKWRFAALLVRYTGSPVGMEDVVPWLFSERTMDRLRTIQPVTCDFYIKCENEDFQQLEFTKFRSSFWQKNPKAKHRVLERFDNMWKSLPALIGLDLKPHELGQLLNQYGVKETEKNISTESPILVEERLEGLPERLIRWDED